MVISALVRGYRLTRKAQLLDLLEQAGKIFEMESCESGVRISLGSRALYTELPGGPSPGILDGFMTSLLGLYDLFVETGDAKVKQLFEQGIEGLKCTLDAWDYRSKWSWYGAHAYLCPPSYHCLNRALLTVLARLSSEPCLTQYANSWDPHHLSAFERAEIYLGFLLTKNACRIRHKTWRQSPVTVSRIASGSGLLPASQGKTIS